MNWLEPAHSRRQADLAGEALAAGATGERRDLALRAAADWRSAHAFPLNAIQMGLRQRVRSGRGYGDVLISQRLKRTPSTMAKLQHVWATAVETAGALRSQALNCRLL